MNIYRLKPDCVGSEGTVFYRIQERRVGFFGRVIWLDFDNQRLSLEKAKAALKELQDFEKENET